ncbi:hypothetical protein CN217_25980 [Sinorhizobium meliloti]|uniref:hypothetical protein n=1 Tax=Rhizobium meliloti TaxID=382 RepID=UPI000FD5DC26|nr:hypothetical protein [Sinorhizobium meliloti]RVH05444.1 hypothetical protein CN217_25980 [Sinorhizobium meliloti]
MRVAFVVVGLIGMAFLAFVAMPSYQLTAYPPDFEGAAGIQLSDEASRLLSQAKTNALILVERQRRWQMIAIWLGFLGLGLTALATIVAGWKSRQSRIGKEEFLNKKITIIGALTAMATLVTGTGDLVEKTGVKPLESDILALKRVLVQVPAEIAADPMAERGILDSLEITIREHSP